MTDGAHSSEGPSDSPATRDPGAPVPPPRVVVPYVRGMLRTEVVDAAIRSGMRVDLVEHEPGDPEGYADVLRRLWREPWEWVICEQDTVPPAGALRAMARCPYEWCTLPHWVGTHWEVRSLGVARFALRLRTRLPDIADQVLGPPAPHFPSRGWPVCDTQLAGDMAARGIPPHVHRGRTHHLHVYGV